ncbi:MAG: hypothetical protein AB1478_12370, partial [Nitrospirota bacterium]
MLVIFETVEDIMGTAFKNDAGSVRYYFLYKFVNALLIGKNGADIYLALRTERENLFDFMKDFPASAGGQNNRAVSITKNKVITTEDLSYIFSTIANAERFMDELGVRAGGTVDVEEYTTKVVKDFKTKTLFGIVNKDKPIWAFLINLWHPIALVLVAVFLNVLPLIVPVAIKAGPLAAVSMSGALGVLIMACAFVVLLASLSLFTNWVNTRGDKNQEALANNGRGISFAFWTFFSLTFSTGFAANYLMLSWAKDVIISLFGFGALGVTLTVLMGLLATLIIVLTFISLSYALQTLFAYYQGKREGVGQIKTLGQAKARFN